MILSHEEEKVQLARQFGGVASKSAVWIGNIDVTNRDEVCGIHQFADPKGYESVTQADRADLEKIRDLNPGYPLYEVVSDRSTQELLDAGYIGVYRMRSALGLTK